MISLVAASASLLIAFSPVSRQSLYRETPDGWFIYVEDRSCVAYADFDEDTMLRFSNRADENRMYFTVVSRAWENLRPRLGETLMLGLEFPEVAPRQMSGALGMIIENPDGRLGYTAADFGNEQILRFVASGGRMVVHAWAQDRAIAPIATFNLTGGGVAAHLLAECTEEHFSS